MKIEAPYKGREDAPATADKAAEPADKPEQIVEDAPEGIVADKRNTAPADETEDTEEAEVEENEDEAESTEVPDPNLIRMRADYSRKTAQIAREREAVEREKAALANRYGVYERVDQLLADNPGLAKTHSVEQLVAMIESGTGPAATSPAIPPEYAKKLAAIEGRLRATNETLFTGAVKATMKSLKAEYGLNDAEVKTVVETAVERGKLDNIEASPEDIAFDLDLIASKVASKRAAVDGQRKQLRQLKDKGKAASVGTPGSPSKAETAAPRAKGWDNLTKQLIAEAKQRRAG